jgi:acyl carrier protein
MGLEAAELIMSVENAFGITISEEEGATLVTPKDLIELIRAKVPPTKNSRCLSQSAFYFIRATATECCGIKRGAFQTTSNLATLISKKHHMTFWNTLQEKTRIQENWPLLSRPAWLISAIWLGVFLVSGVTGLLYGGWSAVLAGSVTLFGGLLLTKPYCQEIPGYYRDVKRLVGFLVSTTPELFKAGEHWSYAQIRQTVRMIVMEVLGVDQYKEEWEFGKDYGI